MSCKNGRGSTDRGLWVQCACTLLVALGAAYASYRHGQTFALRFGADPTTAAIWPLIVDGLLTTETPDRTDETTGETNMPPSLAVVSATSARRDLTAEQRMWVYYKAQRARGRTPSGAELDRVVGTNNYGRRLLRRWLTDGHPTTQARAITEAGA
jgi:hypothetical protein